MTRKKQHKIFTCTQESVEKKKLSKEQYRILREKGTEPAFSGAYYDTKKEGMYHCAGCDAVLFSSKDKFDSSTGWPSYTRARGNSVETREDFSHGMRRMEALCKKCGGHLGHVFDDGPMEGEHATGKRFCINSAALNLEEKE